MSGDLPAAGQADLGLSVVYRTEGVPTIAFLSDDNVSPDRVGTVRGASLGRWAAGFGF